MSARHFEVAVKENGNVPVSFTLAGKSSAGKTMRKTFTCLAYVPAGVQFELIKFEWTSPKIIGFIESVLKDDAEIKRFRAFINGREPLIPMTALAEVVTELIQEYSGRPFGKSKRSARGPKTTSRS